MTTKQEKGLRNSAQIVREDVRELMVRDGLGLDEGLRFAPEMAIELTGCLSPTAEATVARHVRAIAREGVPCTS